MESGGIGTALSQFVLSGNKRAACSGGGGQQYQPEYVGPATRHGSTGCQAPCLDESEASGLLQPTVHRHTMSTCPQNSQGIILFVIYCLAVALVRSC